MIKIYQIRKFFLVEKRISINFEYLENELNDRDIIYLARKFVSVFFHSFFRSFSFLSFFFFLFFSFFFLFFNFTSATTWHSWVIDSVGSLRSKSADTFILTREAAVICVPVITFAWLAADHAWNSLCWNKYVNLHIFLPWLYIYGPGCTRVWMQIYFVRNVCPLPKRTVTV